VSLPIFDAILSRELAEIGIELSGRAAPTGWKLAALVAVARVAKRQRFLTVDDVWPEIEKIEVDDEPLELRAMGSVIRLAVGAGILVATDTYRPSTRVSSHSSYTRVWRSGLGSEAVRCPTCGRLQ